MQYIRKWNGAYALLGVLLVTACGGGAGESITDMQGVEVGQRAEALMASASYDSSLQAPLCTGAASGCSSGTLLNGRASLGPELNAPNTLRGSTCADGTAGTYRVDESVEQVRVSTVDGSTLQVGRQVRVEVTVWAFAAGNHLDLYYTPDATQPVWVYLTTLPATGPGLQTLSATYTLPSGRSVQAVRAAFRWAGSANPCTTGIYDERDDLAFTVSAPPPPPRTPVRLDAGYGHVLALRPDGTVWAWGENFSGQVGSGTSELRQRSPVQVPGLSSVVSVAAGASHSLALRSDGTVWAWGGNTARQLGDGSSSSFRSTPLQVPGLSSVVSVAAGDSHSLALRSDGTVWAWGGNFSGQLGDGSTTPRSTPVQVQGLNAVTAIATGSSHSLALRSDGTVWAWGNNSSGQLGDGTTTSRLTPVQLQGLSAVTAIATGISHSLALRSDGTVWAWGSNSSGQLGDGSTTQRPSPVQVQGLSGVTVLEGGSSYSVVLRSDGTVWTWGDNHHGQLGGTRPSPGPVPAQVPGLGGVVAMAAAGSTCLALDSSNRLWAWGTNESGQFGDGSDYRPGPVQVPLPSGMREVSAGTHHTLALHSDGTVWAWGSNHYGQLGDGTTTSRAAPVQVQGLTGVVAIAAGSDHSMAVRNDGSLWVWGLSKLLINGTTMPLTPVQVPGLTGIVAMAARQHSLVVRSDGTVWAWGYNHDGQLGDGTTTAVRNTPVQVQGLSGVIAVAVGQLHSLAIRNDGTLWAWGSTSNGQLGIGSPSVPLYTTPIQVPGFTGATAVAAGDYHSAAVRSNGTVWTWGANVAGQLGDGTWTGRNTPGQVQGLSGAMAVAAGQSYSLAVRSDGSVWTWGNNSRGQLGVGTLTSDYQLSPVQVALTGLRRGSTRLNHAVALRDDGTVWSWGDNAYGKIGDGRPVFRPTPGLVPLP